MANVLIGTANGASKVCAVILPSPTDAPETREKREQQVKDTDSLIKWGLMKDVSDEFAEQIHIAKINYKVDTRIIVITEQAEILFRDAGTRTIN